MHLSSEETKCLNCEATLVGTFCHSCGQKMLEPSERTFKHFVFQFFGSAFFLENNFLKNVWTLLTKPGKLSLDFMEGKRKRWMTPFSLFFLINIFYFWYTPFSDFNLTLREHMTVSPYKNLATLLVNDHLNSSATTLEEYALRFDKKSSSYVNSFIVLHVPLLAVFLSLLFYKKRYYFADHFIFALHFLGYILLITLGIALLQFIDQYLFSFINPSILQFIKILLPLSIISYGWVALHRFYKQRWWITTLALPCMLVVFLVIHFLFRLCLFLIIFAFA